MGETVDRLVQLNSALVVAVVALVVIALLAGSLVFGWAALLSLGGITDPRVVLVTLSVVILAGLFYGIYSLARV